MKYFRLYGGVYGAAAERFFSARERYRKDVLAFLGKLKTAKALMLDGKILAVRLEDGVSLPEGWVMYDESHIVPDPRTRKGKKARRQMDQIVEPVHREIVEVLAQGGIIPADQNLVRVQVRSYKGCHYAAIDFEGDGPDLSGKFPDGILEVDQAEFDGPTS